MKRKILLFFIILVLSSGIYGCQTPVENVIISSNSTVLLQGFEDYLEVNKIHFINNFGIAAINKDKNFISEGNSSLKYKNFDEIIHNNIVSSREFLVPVVTPNHSFRDLSKVKSIAIDVYNDSEKEVFIYTSIAKKTMSIIKSPGKESLIESKKWTTLEYIIYPQELDLYMDIKNVSHIAFQVVGEMATVYFDNLRLELTDELYVPIKTDLDEGEIMSFDKAYQEVAFIGISADEYSPVLSINNNPDYSKEHKSLKAQFPIATTIGTTYIGFELSNKVLIAAELGAYDEKYDFVFDVYKTYASSQWLIIRFKNSISSAYTNINFIIPEGVGWYKMRVNFGDFVKGVDKIEFFIPTSSRIERVLYFDSIKVEDKK